MYYAALIKNLNSPKEGRAQREDIEMAEVRVRHFPSQESIEGVDQRPRMGF